MYSDTTRFTRNCPECAIVTGGGRLSRLPLHPIPVSRPFQILGVDMLELPKTDDGNRCILVFQDFLTKWPMAFPMPDQKAIQITRLLINEVVPVFGVLDALLSDRRTDLLSHLMRDLCDLLGITKLNTTAHHPQSDGMVERFNRTLKTMVCPDLDHNGIGTCLACCGLITIYHIILPMRSFLGWIVEALQRQPYCLPTPLSLRR